MSHSKNIHAEKSYGYGSDIRTFTKTDVKRLDGNNLMSEDKALKILTTLVI